MAPFFQFASGPQILRTGPASIFISSSLRLEISNFYSEIPEILSSIISSWILLYSFPRSSTFQFSLKSTNNPFPICCSTTNTILGLMAPSRSCVSKEAASRSRVPKGALYQSEPPFRKRLRLARGYPVIPVTTEEMERSLAGSVDELPFYKMSISFGYGRIIGDPDNQTTHYHPIWFRDDAFTLDGKKWRKVSDPKNKSFVESLRDKKLPAEFKEPGRHEILVRIADKMEFPFTFSLAPPKREPPKVGPLILKFSSGKRGRSIG